MKKRIWVLSPESTRLRRILIYLQEAAEVRLYTFSQHISIRGRSCFAERKDDLLSSVPELRLGPLLSDSPKCMQPNF